MKTAIQVVWWIGVGGALLATLAIVKTVLLVLEALRDIERLGEITREAAHGVAGNVAAGSKLADADRPAGDLRDATGALASAAASIEHKFDGLTRGSSQQRG